LINDSAVLVVVLVKCLLNFTLIFWTQFIVVLGKIWEWVSN
jgi:hypothetical protein